MVKITDGRHTHICRHARKYTQEVDGRQTSKLTCMQDRQMQMQADHKLDTDVQVPNEHREHLDTRQDKTRQDKTRQDKTRQDKTRQDKTRQDKTRQDKTRQDKTRQDKTRQDKPYKQ